MRDPALSLVEDAAPREGGRTRAPGEARFTLQPGTPPRSLNPPGSGLARRALNPCPPRKRRPGIGLPVPQNPAPAGHAVTLGSVFCHARNSIRARLSAGVSSRLAASRWRAQNRMYQSRPGRPRRPRFGRLKTFFRPQKQTGLTEPSFTFSQPTEARTWSRPLARGARSPLAA